MWVQNFPAGVCQTRARLQSVVCNLRLRGRAACSLCYGGVGGVKLRLAPKFTRAESRLVTTDPSPTDEDRRVVPFRRRGAPRPAWPWLIRAPSEHDRGPGDLAKFERVEGEDDYRHRMTMNALALVATIVLVVVGVWLATRISDMVKTQDYFLSGRRNCAPIDIGPTERG